MKKTLLLLFIICSVSLYPKEPSERDTIKSYVLGEVISTANKIKEITVASSVHDINYATIHNTDATDISAVTARIPSAMVQTNSRGETMLFLRGAGERQLGLFFDGALINVPWDNRADLSLIPADVISSIKVVNGSGSVLYGANVIGGVVNILSRERRNDGIGGTIRLQGNDAGSKTISGTADAKFGNLNLTGNVYYMDTPGFLLSADDKDAGLDFQNPGSALRTNTDKDIFSLFLRSEYKLGDNSTVGLSVNHINAEKGIAPLTSEKEGKERFWRYPEWKRTMITMLARHGFESIPGLMLRGSIWYDMFNQSIEDYTDFSYSEINEIQDDKDNTLGIRLSADYTFAWEDVLTIAFNSMLTKHEAGVTDTESGHEDISDFSQNLISIGAEYKGKSGKLGYNAGISYDMNKTPKTGVFTENEGQSDSDYGAFAGFIYVINENSDIFINVSRKTRFPTLREAFDGALGKFLPNPGLEPETGLQYETGTKFSGKDYFFRISGFATFYDGLIEKIKAPDDPEDRKTRVNYADALITGIETTISYTPFRKFDINGYFTYMYSDGEYEGKYVRHLQYKPDYVGFLSAGYNFNFGLNPAIETELTGKQFGENGRTGNIDKIEATSSFNFRLSYKFDIGYDMLYELYMRCNNITDVARLSKVGLQMPGRTVIVGIKADI